MLYHAQHAAAAVRGAVCFSCRYCYCCRSMRWCSSYGPVPEMDGPGTTCRTSRCTLLCWAVLRPLQHHRRRSQQEAAAAASLGKLPLSGGAGAVQLGPPPLAMHAQAPTQQQQQQHPGLLCRCPTVLALSSTPPTTCERQRQLLAMPDVSGGVWPAERAVLLSADALNRDPCCRSQQHGALSGSLPLLNGRVPAAHSTSHHVGASVPDGA